MSPLNARFTVLLIKLSVTAFASLLLAAGIDPLLKFVEHMKDIDVHHEGVTGPVAFISISLVWAAFAIHNIRELRK